jgi:hypothetical protein
LPFLSSRTILKHVSMMREGGHRDCRRVGSPTKQAPTQVETGPALSFLNHSRRGFSDAEEYLSGFLPPATNNASAELKSKHMDWPILLVLIFSS